MTTKFPHGVVEGFYGPPWSHVERLNMIRFLGDNAFNTYMYAPKDDPYHRAEWRKDYSEPVVRKLRELIEASASYSVDFIFTVSPGLNVEYSDPDEIRLLLRKFRSVIDMGCTWVGVMLDDIDTELRHERDRKRFPNLARAHAYFVNVVRDELKRIGAIRLIFCPTYYANDYLGKKVPDNEYLSEIGSELSAEVDVLWTGNHVVSVTITTEDARAFGDLIRRKPFLWDNYPVNDYFRPTPSHPGRLRLNMGPFRGRSADLKEHLSGFLSNPMNEAEASRVPLLTLSDYIQNPIGYSPEQSYERALERLYASEKAYADLRLLIDASRAGPLDPREVPELRTLIDEVKSSFQRSELEWSERSSTLGEHLSRYIDLQDRLSAGVRNKKLLEEFQPVIEKLRKMARLGLKSLELADIARSGTPPGDRSLKRAESAVAEAAIEVEHDTTQCLGLVDFGLKYDAKQVKGHGEPQTNQVTEELSGLGLPYFRSDSPVVKLFRWSVRIAGQTS